MWQQTVPLNCEQKGTVSFLIVYVKYFVEAIRKQLIYHLQGELKWEKNSMNAILHTRF